MAESSGSPSTTSETAFLRAYPAYAQTRSLDALRAREYARLDDGGHCYLDYTGGGLYAASQLREHLALLGQQVYGNPHSTNPTSQAATRTVENARAAVLAFFNADPHEYEVVFTANATGALKLVGEAYPFAPGSTYLLTLDNHNSVNGIREFARGKRATITYVPIRVPHLRIDANDLSACLEHGQPGQHNLFAYPAQSNFSGVQHDLAWIDRAQAAGWDVLLDAAAFVPTNRLDLSRYHPDFVPISFYKLMGYPTGLGCLLARRIAFAKLRRPWFAGGTITIASAQADGHYLAPGAPGFEDGTVNYLGLSAIPIGLRLLADVGMETIHTRVMCLTGWLLQTLTAFRHSNGAPLVRILGPSDVLQRGGTIALNLYDPAGRVHGLGAVAARANAANISLRTGCFCNPGADEIAHGLSGADLAGYFHNVEPLPYERFLAALEQTGRYVGAVRVSLGLVTNFLDVERFAQFIRSWLDQPADDNASCSYTPSTGVPAGVEGP